VQLTCSIAALMPGLMKIFLYPEPAMEMRALCVILWFVVAFGRSSYGHDLPIFGAIPKLSDKWRVREPLRTQ
jgi:hypothetical protein